MFHTTGVVHICFCPSVTDGQHSHHTHISFQARLCLTSFLNGAPIDAVFNTWKSLSNVLTGGINKIAAIQTHSSIPPLEVYYTLFHPPDEVDRDQVPQAPPKTPFTRLQSLNDSMLITAKKALPPSTRMRRGPKKGRFRCQTSFGPDFGLQCPSG